MRPPLRVNVLSLSILEHKGSKDSVEEILKHFHFSFSTFGLR